MKRGYRVLSFVVIASTALLTGCWDRMEIEERGTILGLAIDPVMNQHRISNVTGKDAKSDVQGYRLTAQVAIPGRIPLGPSEGGAASSGGENPVWVISTTGKTIDDAMNSLQQELADKIFLGHLRVIIVNQKLVQTTGMHDIQDFFRRNAEIRRLAWLLISKHSAKEAMEASPKLERVPILYLVGTMDHAVWMGKMPNIFLGTFWSVYSSKGQEPVLPIISVAAGNRKKDRIKMEGLAVFKGDRMVGTLDPIETGLYMQLKNQRRAGYGQALPAPGDPHHSVMVRASTRRSMIRLRKEHGKPVFDVYTRLDVNIEEKTGGKTIFTPQAIKHIEDIDAESVRKGQAETMRKLQDMDADIIGFGEYIRGYDPAYWAHIRTREKWEKEFADLPVRFHAQIFIRRVGMSSV